MLRIALHAPFRVFQVKRAFPVVKVRECALLPCRVIGAMELNVEVVAGCGFEHAPAEVNHFLVVPVQEIHHKPLDAPSLIRREGLLQVGDEGLPMDPEADPDTLLLAISDDLRQIQAGSGLGDVRIRSRGEIHLGLFVPGAVVAHDSVIGYAVAGAKVDIVAVIFKSHERTLLGKPLLRCSIPPVPGRFSRTNPREVALWRLVQADQDVAFDLLSRPVRKLNDAPGASVRGPSDHGHVRPVQSRREKRPENGCPGPGGSLKIHPGEVSQGGFSQDG